MTGPSKRAELKVLHAAHAAGKVSDCPTCAVPRPSASDEETARELIGDYAVSRTTHDEAEARIAQALAQARRQGAAAMRERCAVVAETAWMQMGGDPMRHDVRQHYAHKCADAIRALPDEEE